MNPSNPAPLSTASRTVANDAQGEIAYVYVDAAIVVVNKPSGLLSVPGRGQDKQDCVAGRLQAEFPDALTVHRLDMHTSGLLLLARGKEMQRRLSIQFASRQVDKRYLAVVVGELPLASGEIDLPLRADWPNRPRQKIDALAGKPSLTRYQVISHDASANTSRLALIPETGRTHQLRVHLQALGHPIIGDALYGDAASSAGPQRLLLHADQLAFAHPEHGERLSFLCPAPF
ncbi:RluA family pseudouridine synthase [Accumulibacter sp.]|uniref:RluA family pseudouridine synthase n=1 Tax=Accumulibacter sp. TaxID=2053492 RepID=UPI0028C4B54B|nr:RluA family pseudouridine synthase [Accumulibacter sp.]